MENSEPRAASPGLDALRIHPGDNVCIATRALDAGARIQCGGRQFVLAHRVALGAKLVLADLPPGAKIVKFGEPIGTLRQPVRLGDYIHSHNLESDYLPTHARGDPAICN